MAFPKMIRELEAHPELGYLGGFSGGLANPIVNVQYWRSFQHLEDYAKNRNAEHLPAWQNFNKRLKQSGAVGIWHETYLVKAGQYETIYHHMPSHGLGKASSLIPVGSHLDSARERMQSR